MDVAQRRSQCTCRAAFRASCTSRTLHFASFAARGTAGPRLFVPKPVAHAMLFRADARGVRRHRARRRVRVVRLASRTDGMGIARRWQWSRPGSPSGPRDRSRSAIARTATLNHRQLGSRALKNAPRFSAHRPKSLESVAGKAEELAGGRVSRQPASGRRRGDRWSRPRRGGTMGRP
jgi:hypothetical protein